MFGPGSARLKWLVAGVLFAALWGSAATAIKIGLAVAQPLVIAEARFGAAAIIMLVIAHFDRSRRFPVGKEWRQLAIYGLLNITIYLGCYVIAMQTITAGIAALAIATNPVFISFFSVIILKHKLTWPLVAALVVCAAGILCATWPLFADAAVTTGGLLLLFFSMLCYSLGAIYFSSRQWNGLSLFTINGWQTFLGGVFLLPVTLFFYKGPANHFDKTFWSVVGWLAIPVSIVAAQLWLWLLQTNTVRAGLWLFLCPLFGYVFAAWWMKDDISAYTVAGVLLVIGGLLLSKINTRKNEA